MPFSPHWLQINEQVLNFYAVPGAEPPVVFLHGGGWWPVLADTPLLAWGPTLEVMYRRQRAIALDWPACEASAGSNGAGAKQSECPPMQTLVSCMDTILNALNLDAVALVGLSMGGAVAVDYALRYPKRVEKLVLVSPFGLHTRLPLHKFLYLYFNIPLLDEMTWGAFRHMRWMLKPSLRYILHNKRVLTPALLEQTWQLSRASASTNTFFSWLKNEVTWRGMRTSYLDRLHELDMPVLLVHGEKDRLVPVEYAHQAHRRIPNSELIVLPDCGHWPQREYAPAFHRALFDFLGVQ